MKESGGGSRGVKYGTLSPSRREGGRVEEVGRREFECRCFRLVNDTGCEGCEKGCCEESRWVRCAYDGVRGGVCDGAWRRKDVTWEAKTKRSVVARHK